MARRRRGAAGRQHGDYFEINARGAGIFAPEFDGFPELLAPDSIVQLSLNLTHP
jgi:hypothetical protein